MEGSYDILLLPVRIAAELGAMIVFTLTVNAFIVVMGIK